MKKGNVDVRKGIAQTYRIRYADTILFVLHEDELKDLHSLIGELLETETVNEPLEHTVGSHFECKACIQAHMLSQIVSSNSEKEECPTCGEPNWCCAFMKGDDGYCDSCRPKEEVKEEKECDFEVGPTGGTTCKNCGRCLTVPLWPPYCKAEPPKEEPTTPEKKPEFKGCFCPPLSDGSRGVYADCPTHGGKKGLSNVCYEVTCGRCEKSIKHSCGRA